MASGSSAPKLNSIDNLVQATLKRTAPVPNIKIGTSLASSFLAPALRELDKSGTSAGVNALQLCTSALKDGSDALDVLIPDSRPEGRPLPGLGAAYVLSCRLQQQDLQAKKLYGKVTTFTAAFDAHEVLLMPDLFYRIGYYAHSLMKNAGCEEKAIPVLFKLLRGHQVALGSIQTLTALHSLFARACLACRSYIAMLPVLSSPIGDIDMVNAPISIRHHLLYHYYSGCILAAVQQFSKACSYFESAVTAPSAVASAISLDAYKKLILCSLLHNGRKPELPKYTSAPVTSAFNSYCTPYADFASLFVSFDRAKVRELASSRRETFAKDGNWGLILQCFERLKLQAILRLRETYVTVSIREVAEAIRQESGPAPVDNAAVLQAELLVLSLVKSKQLHASIEHEPNNRAADATITFLSDPEPYNSSDTIAMLSSKLTRSSDLGLQSARMSDQMLTNKEFLKKALNASSAGDSGGSFMPSSAWMEEDLLDEDGV